MSHGPPSDSSCNPALDTLLAAACPGQQWDAVSLVVQEADFLLVAHLLASQRALHEEGERLAAGGGGVDPVILGPLNACGAMEAHGRCVEREGGADLQQLQQQLADSEGHATHRLHDKLARAKRYLTALEARMKGLLLRLHRAQLQAAAAAV